MSFGVARHRADGVRALEQPLTLAVGDEDGRVRHLESMVAREPRRAGRRQEHVAAVLHHRDRKVDRMPHIPKARRAADAQAPALHHTRVQLDLTVRIEAGADSGVEQRLVFHVADGGDRGGKGPAPDLAPAGVARPLDGGLARGALALRHRPGAAVHDQGLAGHRMRKNPDGRQRSAGG